LIRDLATYERAPNEVRATETQLTDVLFGEKPAAEVLLAFEDKMPIGFSPNKTSVSCVSVALTSFGARS